MPLSAQDPNNQSNQEKQEKKDAAPDSTAPAEPSVAPGAPVAPGTPPAQTGTPTVQEQQPDSMQAPEYGGPAILSRGGTTSLRTPSQNIKIRPYGTLTGSYDSGLTPVLLNSTGGIVNKGSSGLDAEFGVHGYHRWKSATLGIDYKGTYRDYPGNTSFNGTDQSLSLIFQKQASRHWLYTLRETAGLLNRSLFYYGPYDFVDPVYAQAPTQEVFDGRTLYLNTLMDVTYQKSARLSFNFGGEGYLIRRRASSLYGLTGYSARADIAYRTTRTATTGLGYDFTHFEYNKGFGGSDIHTLTLQQSFRIGRHWELALRAGGSRVESLGLTQVTIDPVIAAIIGRSQGIEVIYAVNWVPTLNAVLTRSFRRATLNFAYERGVTPGNGLFLTSRSESGTASFSYTGIRKLNLGLSGGHTTLSSLTVNTGGIYSSWVGGGGFTYKINGPLSVIGRYDYRHYDINQNTFLRDAYRASIGFAFSPRDIPLTLW
jgi:hypothetical protein